MKKEEMVIEFAGELSNDCKKYIDDMSKQKWILSYYLRLGVLCFLFVSIPIVFLGAFASPLAFLFEFGAIAVAIGIPLIVWKESRQYPTRIIVDDLFVEVYTDKNNFAYRLEKIDKVVDMGDFYHIVLVKPITNQNIVCQKDLLVEGALEQFESLLVDKIIRG